MKKSDVLRRPKVSVSFSDARKAFSPTDKKKWLHSSAKLHGRAFGVLKIYETKRTFLLLSMEEKHHEFTESTGCAGVILVGFISETEQLWRSD